MEGKRIDKQILDLMPMQAHSGFDAHACTLAIMYLGVGDKRIACSPSPGSVNPPIDIDEARVWADLTRDLTASQSAMTWAREPHSL